MRIWRCLDFLRRCCGANQPICQIQVGLEFNLVGWRGSHFFLMRMDVFFGFFGKGQEWKITKLGHSEVKQKETLPSLKLSNISPENQWWEDEISLLFTGPFFGDMLIFVGEGEDFFGKETCWVCVRLRLATDACWIFVGTWQVAYNTSQAKHGKIPENPYSTSFGFVFDLEISMTWWSTIMKL